MNAWMRWGLCVGLSMVTVTASAESIIHEPPLDAQEDLPELSPSQFERLQQVVAAPYGNWDALVEILSRSPQQRFLSEEGELILGRSDEVALLTLDEHNPEPAPNGGDPRAPGVAFAYLGSHAASNPWIELSFNDAAGSGYSITLDDARRFLAILRMQLPDGSSFDEAVALAEAQQQETYAELVDAVVSSDQGEQQVAMRLLRIPHEGGELLVLEDAIPNIAQRWSGEGPLWLTQATFWSENLQPGVSTLAGFERSGFLIADPLSPRIPEPLRIALRPVDTEVRVVEWTGPELARTWSWGSTRGYYRVDKGSVDGLFKGMELRPLGPSGVTLTVDSVAPQHAIAYAFLSRYSPKDPVVEPQPGEVYSTRQLVGERQMCSIDTSAAVRAKITSVRMLDEGKADDEGFVWYEVDIDHGRRHGLEHEQALSLEGGSHASGESRLRRLDANSATLLWRVHSGFSDREAPLPEAGAFAVTRAWQRASEELFGF